MALDREEIYRRPVSGNKVERLPTGLVPARSPIEGKSVRIEPLNAPLHGADRALCRSGDQCTHSVA